MKLSKTLALLAIAALPGLAAAQPFSGPAGARINVRQAEQQHRINQGLRSGELTRREAVRLEQGQARIQRMENRARADGRVTRYEARRIERAQDVQSRRIFQQKHDAQSRW